MSAQKISEGLIELGFNSGWVVSGEEIVLWEHNVPQPTMSEILEASEIYAAKQTQATAEAAAKREAAIAKLTALGLDTEDLKALGL